MIVEVGPYRFSGQDVEATLRHHDDLFALLVEGVDPPLAGTVESHRHEAAAAVETAEPEAALVVLWEQLRAAAGELRRLGAYGADAAGTVDSLHVSDGGVPKRSVERLDVGFRGADGDRQATRRHHGRPWQALSVWSGDVIDALRADGHPIAPGAAGENVTLRGLPWEGVRPGVVLEIGTVRCEVQAFALPCAQNAQWFRDGDFNAMHHRRGPVSRVYATVLEPGSIERGDAARLLATA